MTRQVQTVTPLKLHRFRNWWQVADTPLLLRDRSSTGKPQWVVRGDLLGSGSAVPWLMRHGLLQMSFSTRAEVLYLVSDLDRVDPIPRLPRVQLKRISAGHHRASGGYEVVRSGDRWVITRHGRHAGASQTLFQATVAIASLVARTAELDSAAPPAAPAA